MAVCTGSTIPMQSGKTGQPRSGLQAARAVQAHVRMTQTSAHLWNAVQHGKQAVAAAGPLQGGSPWRTAHQPCASRSAIRLTSKLVRVQSIFRMEWPPRPPRFDVQHPPHLTPHAGSPGQRCPDTTLHDNIPPVHDQIRQSRCQHTASCRPLRFCKPDAHMAATH